MKIKRYINDKHRVKIHLLVLHTDSVFGDLLLSALTMKTPTYSLQTTPHMSYIHRPIHNRLDLVLRVSAVCGGPRNASRPSRGILGEF